jgi:hypothetical protein
MYENRKRRENAEASDILPPHGRAAKARAAVPTGRDFAAAPHDLDYWPLAEDQPNDDDDQPGDDDGEEDDFQVCGACHGSGRDAAGGVCKACGGTGKVLNEGDEDNEFEDEE